MQQEQCGGVETGTATTNAHETLLAQSKRNSMPTISFPKQKAQQISRKHQQVHRLVGEDNVKDTTA